MVIAIAATKCDMLNGNKIESEDQDPQVDNENSHQGSADCVGSEQPAIPLHEAERLAESLGAIFVQTSAKDNAGVDNLFKRVAERVMRYRKQSESGIQGPIPVTPGAVAKDLKRFSNHSRHLSLTGAVEAEGPTNSPFLDSTRRLYDDMSAGALSPIPLPALSGPSPQISASDEKQPSYRHIGGDGTGNTSNEVAAFSFNGFSSEGEQDGGDLSADSPDPSGYHNNEHGGTSCGDHHHFETFGHSSLRVERKVDKKVSPSFCASGPFMCDMFSNSTGVVEEGSMKAWPAQRKKAASQSNDKSSCMIT
jgi:hypothetical protein